MNSEAATGHPKGLRTLFFTEMWERMSYYGMRALLVLFLVDSVESGGLGFTDQSATATYGLYTAAVYLVALPGGWIADRLLGAQRSVLYGAAIIMCGHFVLAIPAFWSFFTGLALVVAGTGLLKPNISAIVGQLYGPDDPRRDAGFTLFYMGINLGAAIGPLICSTLGESDRFGWHWGFAAAGIGMLAGLVQFQLGRSRLGEAGRSPPYQSSNTGVAWSGLAAAVALAALLLALGINGVLKLNASSLATNATAFIASVFTLYFLYVLTLGKLDADEKRKTIVIIILCLASAMFWAGFEQAGSSFTLFAERYTSREMLGFTFPAGWFQSLNPVFIIVFAPVFAWMWVELAKKNLNPRSPAKFAFGLILLAAGFVIMIGAAKLVSAGNNVAPLLADYHLPAAYPGRTVPEPGRAECNQQAGAPTLRRADDGAVVPRIFSR